MQKPKVLVVDDSITIRHGMKELLSKDYDVSLVQSGLSAIQMIILNKPDLVLLDYEMPVCDGQQILAMLRSEKEFADTPVVFLTSKTDQESVRKVVSLKPEGYLSKYLKLSDIKQKIDDYFERKKVNGKIVTIDNTIPSQKINIILIKYTISINFPHLLQYNLLKLYYIFAKYSKDF
ncbi:MAG: response regulator [Firmicutes bacterium]|nr:response regulator [Bacillota bacterium]